MSWRLDVRAGAESDISEAVKWYEEERPGLGLELIDEIRAAINRVVESPARIGCSVANRKCVVS